jgi:hypothetical protein
MLAININWEYLLGIFGTLIALAYYANRRLTRLETNFDWLADAVRDLTNATKTGGQYCSVRELCLRRPEAPLPDMKAPGPSCGPTPSEASL